MERNRLSRGVDLAQKEGRKRIPGLPREIVASCVVASRFQIVKDEVAALRAGRPSRERELVPTILKADFNGVLPFDPREVVGELPAIVGQEAKFPPAVVADRVVGNISL